MCEKEGFKTTEAGKIPEGWKFKPFFSCFSKVIDFRGRTPLKLGMEWGGTIPALSASNVRMGGIDLQYPTNYGNELLYEKWMSGNEIKPNDILMTMEAPLGNVALVKDKRKYILSQRVIGLRIETSNDARFLQYILMSDEFQTLIESFSTGSTAKGINQKNLKKLFLTLPPLPEQHKIADILSTVDEHISETESLIKKTKVLKQGMMQQLLAKGIGHTEFKDTEIGRIPVEWEVVSVGECFSISGGVAVSRAGLGDFGIKYLHYGDIHVKNQLVFDVDKDAFWIPKVDPATIVEKKDSLLQTGDIVFADASEDYDGIGKSVVINNQVGEKYLSGLHTIVAKSLNDELEYSYRKYMLSTSNVRKQFVFYAAGASVYGISKKNIALIKFAKPLFTEQQKIASILTSIDDQISDYQTKLTSLTKLKSALMQQLLTGKTRVKI